MGLPPEQYLVFYLVAFWSCDMSCKLGFGGGKHKDFGPEAQTQISYTIIIAITCLSDNLWVINDQSTWFTTGPTLIFYPLLHETSSNCTKICGISCDTIFILALAFGGIFLTSILYWSSRLRMYDWNFGSISFKKMN